MKIIYDYFYNYENYILFLQMHPVKIINNGNKDIKYKYIIVLLIIKKKIKQFKIQQRNGQINFSISTC